MRKIIYYIVLPLLLFSISCNEKKESTKMKEVMAVHDEVMPKMGQLGKLVGELKGMETDSTDIGRQYKEARIELQDANKAMMDWMKYFGDHFTPDEIMNGAALSDEKIKWLNEEEEKAKALRNQINSSIENAKKILEAEKQ